MDTRSRNGGQFGVGYQGTEDRLNANHSPADARQRKIREKRQMLFPISLVPFVWIKEWEAFDADAGKDSAREIPEYFIPDFSNWKDHDSYQRAFQGLLRDLKAEANVIR